MSSESTVRSDAGVTGIAVFLGQRFATPERFHALFTEGMALVECAASYLEGEGRHQAKKLAVPLSVIYATESMRLTTRLLELASWLLIQRKLMAGEMTVAEADQKRQRIKLKPLGRPVYAAHYDELPGGLCRLIEASFALNDRILQFDQAFQSGAAESEVIPMNPVAAQHARLRAAFSRGRIGVGGE
jgi:regulator of CtrA degradation